MKTVSNSSIEIRNSLALSRSVMANERTLLAYIRTGLTLIVSGGGIIRFIQDGKYILFFGLIFIAIGIFFLCWGIYRFRQYKNLLKKTYPRYF